MPDIERYSEFAEHPRYGRGPRFTGLNPQTDFRGDTFLHWHSPKSCRIQKTAIAADLNKQVPATVAVTHYYDVERKCRECECMFIFFAAEQKYWYEELQFSLNSDCVRCFPCRSKQHGLTRARQQYEELFHKDHRTLNQNLELAEHCLDLIENKVFTPKQTQHIRRLLNLLNDEFPGATCADRVQNIRERLHGIESTQ